MRGPLSAGRSHRLTSEGKAELTSIASFEGEALVMSHPGLCRNIDNATAVSSSDMYCPSCGSDERQPSQYCRACGTDLRGVRITLERPDSITASAVSARQQIGLAIADRIRQVKTGKELEHIAEDVLPQIEKFLESPEERRLRRIRAGLITAAIGFGGTAGAFMLTLNDIDALVMMVPPLILFLIGLGVLMNGMWFTVPSKEIPQPDVNDLLNQPIDLQPRPITQNMSPSYQSLPASSVTEHTTHHLSGTSDSKSRS